MLITEHLINAEFSASSYPHVLQEIQGRVHFFLDLTDRSITIRAMSQEKATRTRILTAARERFHHRSYADVGVAEICEDARIQKGSFYHFFRSKQDLAVAVIDDMAEDWAHGFLAEAFDRDKAPLERLDAIAGAAYRWQNAAKEADGCMPGCLFGNLALELSTRDEVLRARLVAVFNQAKSQFYETLKEAVEAAAIAPLNLEATAGAMLSYLEGVIMLAKAHNDPGLILVLAPAIKTLRIELAG